MDSDYTDLFYGPRDPYRAKVQVRFFYRGNVLSYEDSFDMGLFTGSRDKIGELREISMTVGKYAAYSLACALANSMDVWYNGPSSSPDAKPSMDGAGKIQLDIPDLPIEKYAKRLAYEIVSQYGIAGSLVNMADGIASFLIENPVPGSKLRTPEPPPNGSPKVEEVPKRSFDYNGL